MAGPPMKPNESLVATQIPLRAQELGTTVTFPREMLVDFKEGSDLNFIRNVAIADFRTYAYSSDPRETVDEFTYEVIHKPWWIPKFAWNRLRRETVRRKKVYTAMMLYPDLDLPMPEQFGQGYYKVRVDEWERREEA